MHSSSPVLSLDSPKPSRRPRILSVGALLAWLALSPLFGQAGGDTGSAGEIGSVGDTGSSGDTGSVGDTGSGGGSAPTLGYNPVANTIAPAVSVFYSFTSGSTTGTGFVVPFQVNSLGGTYSLASASLLVSGTGLINNVSLQVLATLPVDATAPTALTTFSNPFNGSPGSTPTAYTFNADSSPTLTAGTTYYLRIGYTGPDTLNWIRTGDVAFGSGDIPALTFIDTAFPAGTHITYRQVDADGFTDLYDTVGGFSITANAVSAVPEPGATAACAGAATLLAGLVLRWKRRAPAPAPVAAAVDGHPAK